MSSGSQQNNLEEITSNKRTRGYYGRGKFFTMEKIHNCLLSFKDRKSVMETMKKNIDNVKSDGFLRVPLEFPVFSLQHVTSSKQAKQILESESFQGREHERPEFNDLSFWSADISSDDIEKARHQAYETLRMVVKPEDMETFHEEMKEQFANSPAFDKSASCYGNFEFSFPLSLLLCRYKTQHCKGGEPQLRILGSDIYKQEIAHYIVVHGPDTEAFNDLPMVPTMSTITAHNPVVCLMDETLCWRPQSTSSSLYLKITEDSRIQRDHKPQKPRRKMCPHVPSCVWNHLVLAFHLPNAGRLRIPVQYLLRNLTPCDALQPFLRENPIKKHQAREMIRSFKKRSSPDSRKEVPRLKKKRPNSTPHDEMMRAANKF